MNRLTKAACALLVVASAVTACILLADYFEPAQLEVDVNSPRIRLVRRRAILPNQEFELEWKRSGEWTFSTERPAVFGRRIQGGFYAWEIKGHGSRFEDVYAELHANDEWLRTNIFVFELNTRDLIIETKRIVPAEAWARRRPDSR